jgi:D-arabinose 1-dehydrogenase-like Zn-dependent alcohol dehydrogenase
LTRKKDALEQFNKFGCAKVILATVPSEKAMSEILEGLAVNGKIVIIGASNEPKVPPLVNPMTSFIVRFAG